MAAATTLDDLRRQAAGCQACDLWRTGTQTVFGEGSTGASLMLVGEQPGDREDVAGRPFVGPAGRLLDDALREAGIDREQVYVTNVVKHFKWEAQGKRRLHKKPNAVEISACRPWLDAELGVVKPQLVVCLGAIAAQALLGRSFRVTKQRGELVETEGGPTMTATIHPSSILRAPDEGTRRAEMAAFVDDLRKAAKWLAQAPRPEESIAPRGQTSADPPSQRTRSRGPSIVSNVTSRTRDRPSSTVS